jgi:hypothetical protein
MDDALSARSATKRWKVAAVFAGALAKRSNCEIVLYETIIKKKYDRIGSILRFAEDVRSHVGGGTQTWGCVNAAFSGHDRIVILTDEQTADSRYAAPSTAPDVPTYVWNLAGYGVSMVDPGRAKYVLGGLSDASFRLIPLLERGKDAPWPWEL